MLTRARLLFFALLFPLSGIANTTSNGDHSADVARLLRDNNPATLPQDLIIKDIHIEGNKHVATGIFLNKIPYKKGEVFDPSKSYIVINNLYGLGHFKQVELQAEATGKEVTLYIVVQEKEILDEFVIEGNRAVSTKKINEKFFIEKLSSIDDESVRQITEGIRKLYSEENHHMVAVNYIIEPSIKNPGKVNVKMTINDGPRSTIFKISFVGNKKIPSRKLRNVMASRENWLLNFMDGGGTYNQEHLEYDQHLIERLYKEHGYLNAKVYKVDQAFSENKKNIELTYHIKEGDQYIVRSIKAPGDEIFGEEELLPLISLEVGKPFATSEMMKSMARMRDLWGEKGYIYADVTPHVTTDDATKEADVTLFAERGKRLFVNRITISGNHVTRDKVIRRQLDIEEGDLITTKKLAVSKTAVEYLSFFERDGVNWHVHRIADNLADLELNVQEAKTGNFNFQASYGSDQYSATRSLRGMITLEKKNVLGLGWDIGGLVQADRKRVKRLEVHFFDPYVFDTDVSAGGYVYKRVDEYDQWAHALDKTPIQKTTGSNLKLGFRLPSIDKRLQIITDCGIENIRTNNPTIMELNRTADYTKIIERTLQQGTMAWLGLDVIRDTRNHQVYPSSGGRLGCSAKLAPTGVNNTFSLVKGELFGSAYTAIMGTDTLVLGMQLKGGVIRAIDKEKIVPYKELFHIGGQTTVRGFTWGSIGPCWGPRKDPLGAGNYVQFNMELIFPIHEGYSMKGHLFYDNGAGWDTPKNGLKDLSPLAQDTFNLRHSVGFGFNISSPMPAKIDWGFKLDRKPGESPSEFHLSMNYAW